MSIVRKRILIEGIVQGVGFRPFVYRLAVSLNLKGFVANSSRGVEIQVEGDSAGIEWFLERLKKEAPAQSKISRIDIHDLSLENDLEFAIRSSLSDTEPSALISPDIATCDDCLRELFDPRDRRYRYPFINCTNCGPRFTILKNIPYDRPNTTMSVFRMCPDCQNEYDDPNNRRFHAQPNACPVCGPEVWLCDAGGRPVECADPIRKAVDRLKRGDILAVKGIGGFHLACDATNEEAVRRLRKRKAREEKPLAVMIPNVSVLGRAVRYTPLEKDILLSPRRPIVLLPKKHTNPVAEPVAPRNPYLGILLPYTPLHHLLLNEGIDFLVMTSGNLSEEPIAFQNDEAVARLGNIADFFFMHNRDIFIRNDDSVVRVAAGLPRPIRRSRGFAPEPVLLRQYGPSILAVGGELKNAICLTRGDRAFLSQHIGDLENAETLASFEQSIRHFESIFEIQPEAVAYDLHPEYLASRWALEQKDIRLVPVQHHHAHIASCLAENGREDRVIGISLDGTGFGSDGQIWGGEILIADLLNFTRVGHFSNFPIAGGDKAVREPWRSAVGLLYRVWKNRFGSEPDAFSFLEWIRSLSFVQLVGANAVRTVFEMIRQNINTVQTSSLGRLFDGVSALTGIVIRSAFEGQAAVELEMAMENFTHQSDEAYAFSLIGDQDLFQIVTEDVILDMVQDISTDTPQGLISLKFHRGLVQAFIRAAERVRESTGLLTTALSGGCFQNRFLLENTISGLNQAGFEVLTHALVPTNDGGLALGQAAVAFKRVSVEADLS